MVQINGKRHNLPTNNLKGFERDKSGVNQSSSVAWQL